MKRIGLVLAGCIAILPSVTMAQKVPDAFTVLRDCMLAREQDDNVSDAATIARALVASCRNEFTETWRTVGIPYNWRTATTLGLDRRDLDYATQFVLTQRQTFRMSKQCLDKGFQIAQAMQESQRQQLTPEFLDEMLRRLALFKTALLDNPRSCPLHLIRHGNAK